MWQFFESFNDPRWRQERRFLCIFLPIILLVTAVSLSTLLWEKLFPIPEPPDFPTPEPVAIAVPPPTAKQEPIATPHVPDLSRGEAALNQGDFVSARILLTKAVADEGSRSKAYYGLGLLELKGGNAEKAIANFTEAIADDGENGMYFYQRSEALRQIGNQQEAVADLRKARQIDPVNPLYSNKLLLTRMEAGDKEAVFREMKTHLELSLTAGQADWLGGAAAIEIEAGNTQHSVAYLQVLRPLVSRSTFNQIVRDRFFDRHRNDPEFSQLILLESGP